MEPPNVPHQEVILCPMCYFQCASQIILLKHVVRTHKHDPAFTVKCTQEGCGATYRKWKSFKQHFRRNHAHALPDIADLENEDHIPIDNMNNEAEGEDVRDRGMSVAETLEWNAAKFLVYIRETCKVSHTATEHIIEGVRSLFSEFSSLLLEQVQRQANQETQTVHLNTFKDMLQEEAVSSTLFSSVDTRYKLDKFLVEKFEMVMPVETVVGRELIWKRKRGHHGIPDIVEVENHAIIVPFLSNLKTLLCNDDVRFCVDNPREKDPNVYRTGLDGSFYQNSEYFQNNRNALAIILYYDDLTVVNPLGANTINHKLSMVYFTIGNIYPELRSSLKTVFLVGVAKHTIVKRYGIDKILEPFRDDLRVLQDEGITINVQGEGKLYKGSLLFVAGDTPASGLLGGFKESVAAYHPCRTCLTTSDDWKHSFLSENFVLRDRERHEHHLQVITDPRLTGQQRTFWSRRYGVNRRSALMDIPHFDITKCLPHDGMHVAAEGFVEVCTRAFLKYCIVERKIFTVADLNSKLKGYNFGHLQNDAPAPLLDVHLDNGLRQSAAQIIVLAHSLPFLIHEWLPCYQNNNNGQSVDNDDPNMLLEEDFQRRIQCYIRLLQIINVCFSYEISVDSVDLLSRMIDVHHNQFKELYPGNITPTFHFSIHAIESIKLFGPLRQQMCFRFEAEHSYFKSLVPVVRSFKNIPKTLAYRHQARQCSRLATLPNASSKRYLYDGDQVSSGITVLLENLADAPVFDKYIFGDEKTECQLMRTPQLKIHGTAYKPGGIILLKCEEDDLPQFGEIEGIYIYKDRKFLLFSTLETAHYDWTLNAYYVFNQVPNVCDVIEVTELIFPHPLLKIFIMDQKYVVLLNHSRTEFFG